jgi:putative cell wall-binding protein
MDRLLRGHVHPSHIYDLPFEEVSVSLMTQGLRRVGIVGLSTLVATSMMSLSATASFAAPGDFVALTHPNVEQGQSAAPAGSLTLDFANNWLTGASQTFTIKPHGAANDCSTVGGISSAVGFAAVPVVALSDPPPANNVTDTTPAFTAALGSTGTCGLVGVKDTVTITTTLPANPVNGDTWRVTLSGITYNIGATTLPGNINVATAGGLATTATTPSNAAIQPFSFTNTPLVAALPGATGVSLGTQTFTEGSAGTVFPAGATTTVNLALPAGVFTAGVTPTITVPATYTVVKGATAGTNAYSFTVTAPTPALKATVTVSGLTSDVGATVSTHTLTAGTPAPVLDMGAVKVVNVVNYGARTGGATRYETAAVLFNNEFGDVSTVVLASGANFPDALSANYLSGRAIGGGTGTLLTDPNNLSDAARFAIFGHGVSTVYITGGTSAVSQNVQDQIGALHISNNPAMALITTIRLGGANRYDTNVLVNSNNFAGHVPTVLLSSGLFFPDALSLGPVSAHLHMPLILTNGVTLGSQENAQLSAFTPTNVVIAGGINVVSQAIQDSLVAQGYTVLRLAGADRTQTAAAVATWATVGAGATPGTPAITAGQGFQSDTTYISTGNNFADALAAGPVAGHNNHMIVLSGNATVLGAGIPSYLGAKTVGATVPSSAQVGTLSALGLTAAVSPAVMQAAAVTIGNP